ncbi:hypothetical protein [Shewanella piezotolerans]|nr:hypothetical protein [Shewanella piezotolerans]
MSFAVQIVSVPGSLINMALREYMSRLILLIIICMSFSVKADKEAPSKPFIATQDTALESYYFKMIPEYSYYENGALIVEKEAWGKAYRLNYDGSNTELWSVSGWYAREVYLAGKDAQNLVRLGDWPRGHELKETDLAVAFYDSGRLIKSYSTKDLIKNKNSIDLTVSHYRWLESHEFNLSRSRFTLTTLGGTTYRFSVSTGDIVE